MKIKIEFETPIPSLNRALDLAIGIVDEGYVRKLVRELQDHQSFELEHKDIKMTITKNPIK